MLTHDLNLYLKGGGSMESGFRSAAPASVRGRIWEEQLSTDEKFRPPSASKVFDTFSPDPKGVLYTQVATIE